MDKYNCDTYAVYHECKHTKTVQPVVSTVSQLNTQIENLKAQLVQRDATISELRDNLALCSETINDLQFLVNVQE